MGKRSGVGRNPEPISEKRASDLDIVSSVNAPIRTRPRLNRSLLFAEISMLSYLRHDEAQPVFSSVGFTSVEYIERDGAQVYLLGTEDDLVVACRGTEPNEWNDIKADANALTDLAETVGRVHRGFKREVDDIWPVVETSLLDDERTVWFCGHSLGGAMATICASRADHMDPGPMLSEVHTFGSPRVGTKRYINNHEVQHVRWVNNNDIVARVPPRWFGYGHTGTLMYLDRNGNHRHLTPALRGSDRWAGFWSGLKNRQFDHFSDHASAGYVDHIRRATEAQSAKRRPPGVR
ncbi:MAG: lipase family protein [Ilumatobacteraceae bacterium]|nr:lipase family protein [Ilumatobacteraceae bacterium]